MCSKMNSGSYGTRDDYDDVVDVDDYSGLCLKKQKHNNGGRRRVPRRGPGVAELEKIRLEEQHISTNLQLLPHSNQLEKPLSFTDKTGPVYPFSPYLTNGIFSNDLIPPVFNHWKHDSYLQYLPPMNLPDQGSGRFYQFIEPPKQTSCLENVTQFQDEEKIVTAKRPRHVMTETGKCNVGSNIINISRDGKQIRSLDLRLKNQIQDSGTIAGNQITIESYTPAIPAPNIPRFPVRKPFYSFLGSNKQSTHDQDQSVSLRTERYDTVTDQSIDLRLKL